MKSDVKEVKKSVKGVSKEVLSRYLRLCCTLRNYDNRFDLVRSNCYKKLRGG